MVKSSQSHIAERYVNNNVLPGKRLRERLRGRRTKYSYRKQNCCHELGVVSVTVQ